MTDDIVTRLRQGWRECSPDDVREAADEIERLQALVERDERGGPMFVILRRCCEGKWSVAAQDVPGEQRASVLRTWRTLGYTVLAVPQPETHNATSNR